MRFPIRQGVCAGVIALLAVSLRADAQEINWSGSLGFAAGSYIFSEQYRSFSLLNAVTIRGGRLEVTASLPIVAQNGTAVNYLAGIAVPTGGPESGVVNRRQQGKTIGVRGGRRGTEGSAGAGGSLFGLTSDPSIDSVTAPGSYAVHVADPMVGARHGVYEGTGTVRSLDLQGWAKAPLSSVASGVGTGAWDYGAGASIAVAAGRSLVFADATWWVLGDLPDLPLHNALFYSLSVGHPVGDTWSMIASVSASTRIVEGTAPPVSAHMMLSHRFTGGASLGAGIGAGLSESASAMSLNLGWSVPITGSRPPRTFTP